MLERPDALAHREPLVRVSRSRILPASSSAKPRRRRAPSRLCICPDRLTVCGARGRSTLRSAENKILGVEEPEVCKYTMRFETPAACTDAHVDEARRDLAMLQPDAAHDEL